MWSACFQGSAVVVSLFPGLSCGVEGNSRNTQVLDLHGDWHRDSIGGVSVRLDASDKAPGHTGSGCSHKEGKDCSFSASKVVEGGRCPEFTGRGRWGVEESDVGVGGATEGGSCNLKWPSMLVAEVWLVSGVWLVVEVQ